MATIQELSAALVKADRAGNIEDALVLANAIRELQATQPAEDAGESRLDIARRRQRESIAALKPTPEEPDFLDQIEEFGKGIPRGALGLLESAALGGAAVFDEEAELKAREAIQDVGRSAQSYFAPDEVRKTP